VKTRDLIGDVLTIAGFSALAIILVIFRQIEYR